MLLVVHRVVDLEQTHNTHLTLFLVRNNKKWVGSMIPTVKTNLPRNAVAINYSM